MTGDVTVKAFQPVPEGLNNLVLTWYSRVTRRAIEATVDDAIKEGVRKHLMEDPEFRAQVTSAIAAAAASLPLEAITKAVKEAIVQEPQSSAAKH